MNRLFLFGVFLLSFSLPGYAQFIGIRLGIPNVSIDGVGNGVIAGGGGSIPNNAMTFNGQYMLFNGSYMTFTHS